MNIISIITKKKNSEILTKEEIDFVVEGYTKDLIPDYQISALLMAICINKMNEEETFYLANAMKNSGDIINLEKIEGIKVDKHSTGGVGDKTTLIVAPLAAAIGVKVAKMSGRGLGFTGGTIDKMESIPGMKTTLEENEFFENVNNIGLSVIGQTGKIAPADKKLYALRDVTGTVENISLIASSIMSKKLAAGGDKILLDVKCGSGGFMKTLEEATELANAMVKIGKNDGKETVAMITDMNQPLGQAVGNTIEVIEAIETLKGRGPSDITELAINIVANMALLAEKADTLEEGIKLAEGALKSGEGLNKLRAMILAQGGEPEVIENYEIFPKSTCKKDIVSNKDGYVKAIATDSIGNCSRIIGAGRTKKEDNIDLGAGILLYKKIGDFIKKEEVIATIYTSKEDIFDEVENMILDAIELSDSKVGMNNSLIKVVLK